MSATAPEVSLITPTRGRDIALPAVHRALCAQTISDFEWLILDDSPASSRYFSTVDDPRVRYVHCAGASATIGSKRNWLVENARGGVIAHIDDDDYYAPRYLERMLSHIRDGADLVKLSGWYLYSLVYEALGYWDLEMKPGIQFVWTPEPIKVVDMGDTISSSDWQALRFGFGFSYVYRKTLWDAIRFPDKTFDEDSQFMRGALARDATICLLKDHTGLVLHTLHDRNISICLPQFILPSFFLSSLFPPDAAAFLDHVRGMARPRHTGSIPSAPGGR